MSRAGRSARTREGRLRRRLLGGRPGRATAATVALGVLAVAAAAATPAVAPPEVATEQVSTALFAVGAAALAGGALDYLLVPGRSPTPAVAADVYAAHLENVTHAAAEHDLAATPVYLPLVDGERRLLFLPADAAEGSAPAADLAFSTDPERGFPADWTAAGTTDGGADEDGAAGTPHGGADDDTDHRADGGPIPAPSPGDGERFTATGERLYRSVEAMTDAAPPEGPGAATARLCDGLVNGLELARGATPLAVGNGRVRVAVDAVTVPEPDRLDHPVTSLLGVGLATAAGTPVSVETGVGDEADLVVRCRWDAAADRWSRDEAGGDGD